MVTKGSSPSGRAVAAFHRELELEIVADRPAPAAFASRSVTSGNRAARNGSTCGVCWLSTSACTAGHDIAKQLELAHLAVAVLVGAALERAREGPAQGAALLAVDRHLRRQLVLGDGADKGDGVEIVSVELGEFLRRAASSRSSVIAGKLPLRNFTPGARALRSMPPE